MIFPLLIASEMLPHADTQENFSRREVLLPDELADMALVYEYEALCTMRIVLALVPMREMLDDLADKRQTARDAHLRSGFWGVSNITNWKDGTESCFCSHVR
jgi:hypothetical protein